MLQRNKKIILIGLGTIFLPIILFMVYEVSSLQEDEVVLEQIYANQLDFVIFSANQFSTDFLDDLIDNVEEGLDDDGFSVSEKTRTLLNLSGCHFMQLQPVENHWEADKYYFPKENRSDHEEEVQLLIDEAHETLEQLVEYKKNDYRKIQPGPLAFIDSLEHQVLYAILSTPSEKLWVMTGLINPATFTNEVLSPKLQQIAQDDLVISLINESKNSLLFASDSSTTNVIASKAMWLFPGLKMGISLKNKTLGQLINQRLKYNLLASGLLIVLLIFGLILVGRNLYQQLQLAQTKADFVSNVSHELRTPLALISMFAETLLLQRVKKEEKKAEYVEIIFKETNRLTRIVNRILNFSQIEAERKKYHLVTVDLNQIIAELIHDYSFHLEQNGFEYKVSQSGSLQVTADKEAVYEALVNLIDNAIKYSKEKKILHISTYGKPKQAIIEISDSGIGIPGEKLTQIFDKFYRVSEGNVHDVQGAGLGLSLVASIMEAHNGKVEVESEIGKGSSFRLVFNLKEQTDG